MPRKPNVNYEGAYLYLLVLQGRFSPKDKWEEIHSVQKSKEGLNEIKKFMAEDNEEMEGWYGAKFRIITQRQRNPPFPWMKKRKGNK